MTLQAAALSICMWSTPTMGSHPIWNIAHCRGVGYKCESSSPPTPHLDPITLPCNWDLHTWCFFFVERILSCLVMIQADWMDWYFQTIARVKNLSCFRIMAVTVGAEFLSSLNKTWRQFLQFNLFERAPKIYPWLPLVTIISELSMGPQRMDGPLS